MDLSGPVNRTLYTQQASGYHEHTRCPTLLCSACGEVETPFVGEMLCYYVDTASILGTYTVQFEELTMISPSNLVQFVKASLRIK